MVKSLHPEIHLFCRDDYFLENFGHFTFDAYTREAQYAQQCFWQHVKETIEEEGIFLIDCWTGWARTRRRLVTELRSVGIDQVICWFFNPSLESITRWFVQREYDPTKKWEREEALVRRCKYDYELFYKNLEDVLPAEEEESIFSIDKQYDDLIIINPEQRIFPGMPLV